MNKYKQQLRIERFGIAINILERAKNFNMSSFQGGGVSNICSLEKELHKCGNTACFAGHVAVSPEFRNIGGYACPTTGTMILNGRDDEAALAEWLLIPVHLASNFIFGEPQPMYDDITEHFYKKPLDQITTQDVIKKLQKYRKKYIRKYEAYHE